MSALAQLPGLPKAVATASPGVLTLSRMLIALAWMMTLAVWGAVGWQLAQGHSDALRAEQRQAANLARVLQEQTERVFATTDQAMLRLAGQVAGDGLAPPDLVRLANETGLAPRILVQLSLVGADGVFVGSNLDPQPSRSGRVDLSDREHVRVHLQPQLAPEATQRVPPNGLFIGRPVLGKVSKRWTIQLSRRILAADGQVLGVVVASLDPAYFEQLYRQVALGKEGGVTLVGTDLQIRARVIGGQSLGMGQSLSLDSPLARPGLGAQGEYRSRSTIDGVERLFAYRRIGDYPLNVVVVAGVEEALSEWYAHRNSMVLLASLLTLAMAAGALLVVSGVRRLEAAHEALRASEAEAQRANQAKSEFLTAISHELRTPLTSIRGFAELMEKRLPSPVHREQAGLIRKGAEHLNALLTDILDLSRVETGALPLVTEPTELRQLVDDTIGFFAVSAAERGLALSGEVERTLPERLPMDRLRVRQILNNLLANALKFTPSGSVRLEVDRQGDCWCCHVIDTGPGIAPELQELVFEKFRQAHDRVSYQHGGTGLGLALSRSLAMLMGGTLTVSSQLGHGSRFTLCLPLPTART